MEEDNNSFDIVDEEQEQEQQADDENTMATPHTSGVKRRSEADLRDEYLEHGALLLHFNSPLAAVPQADVNMWRSIEKKGFRVTVNGCLVPHKLHCFESHHRNTAAPAALRFFKNSAVDHSMDGQRNALGWPCHQEYSHLCHCSQCCNPDHVVIEAFWKNRKRNFCGIDGHCDCGMVPPCLHPYHHNKSWAEQYLAEQSNLLMYSTPDLGTKLRAMFPFAAAAAAAVAGVKVLPKEHYKAEDQKRANRIVRLKRERKHKKEHKRKQAKLEFKRAAGGKKKGANE
jgi:hypothetical protein